MSVISKLVKGSMFLKNWHFIIQESLINCYMVVIMQNVAPNSL